MKGIADGATKAGVHMTWLDVLAWNAQEELTDYWWPNAMVKDKYLPRIAAPDDHCSAFLAAGSATEGGKIVMAHNSWNNFEWGQFANLILDIKPDKGQRTSSCSPSRAISTPWPTFSSPGPGSWAPRPPSEASPSMTKTRRPSSSG